MALTYNQALTAQPNFSELVEITPQHKNLLETLHSLDADLEHRLSHPIKLSRSVRLSH